MEPHVEPHVAARRRTLLRTAHVLAIAGLLGADLALLALAVAGARGADAATVYPAARVIATWLAAPLATASLGTGALAGLLTPWGLLRHRWVTVKLGITVLLTGVLLLVLVPAVSRAADIATGPGPQLLTEGQRRRLVVGPAVAAALLTLNVALGIYKPGGRRHSAGRAVNPSAITLAGLLTLGALGVVPRAAAQAAQAPRAPSEVFVLATLYRRHLSTPAYGLDMLRRAGATRSAAIRLGHWRSIADAAPRECPRPCVVDAATREPD
jgi:hypothetical protein